MEARMTYMLAFIGFLVLLRLFERAMERSVTPFDPFDRITDFRRHMDRERDRTNPPGKDLTGGSYDKVALEQLRRVHERRRRIVPDTGQRRRKDDKR
jgi:hypothetical protein